MLALNFHFPLPNVLGDPTDNDDALSQKILFAFLATFLVGCAGIVPLLFIPLATGAALREKGGKAAKTLNNFLSFAVGALLGDVFLHLLPEAYAGLMSLP